MPQFLRKKNFWRRILNPLAQNAVDPRIKDFRIAAATHHWSLGGNVPAHNSLTPEQIGLIDIAQSILERGSWTLPSWRLEQYLAEKFKEDLGWEISQDDSSSGDLSFSIQAAKEDSQFQNCLVTARWATEAPEDAASEIWNHQEHQEPGSEAEKRFLEEVLIPVLQFPLLDYLRLQPSLISLGVSPGEFADQRADFCIDTGRGLRLVIEVDGLQHNAASQQVLDEQRDQALVENNWVVWRVPTASLNDVDGLQNKLREKLQINNRPTWGVEQKITEPRSTELLTCVWGATVAARIQFLLLESLRRGILPWDSPWKIAIYEADTNIGNAALEDAKDWFGRLRELFGMSQMPEIKLVGQDSGEKAQLVIDVSVIQPHRPPVQSKLPVAWSRPANYACPIPQRKFNCRMLVPDQSDQYLVESFVQDLIRKAGLREGQFEIIARILMGKDVIGLLPTGGGKSLTYQLCGLLLGGMTIYVSPLKSLLQDQRERFLALGVDLVQEISSALNTSQRNQAGQLLTAGGIRFLLISPERFLMRNFRTQLDQFRVQCGEVSQVVIDECHCVSEWGHNFRPAYLSLSRIVKDRTMRLGVSAPLVALTGTASSIVLADLKRELGVLDNAATIRAKRLDRPEIAMSCIELGNGNKADRLRQLAHDFLINSTSLTDGMLVFTQFIGRLEGVVGVTAALLRNVPQDNMRFYTGSTPDWKNYAAFVTGRRATNINNAQALNLMPAWAQGNAKPLEWEQVKAKVQSDFISGLDGNYQVLVATNAFGMGIDKPSIRCVVHYMTPQSPEAYYQEVGRAGRDKRDSKALLLFSDEEPDVTDQILDPGKSIDEVKQIYDGFTKAHPFQGGDFIKTFHFHQESFSGTAKEVEVIEHLLNEIRQRLAAKKSLIFGYTSGAIDQNAWRNQKNQEYGIVRLIILGVVRDYTKDYNAKHFELLLEPSWEQLRDDPGLLADYYSKRFREYAHRYQTHLKTRGEDQIRAAVGVAEIEKATASAIVGFVYEQVERKRRQASRQMLELARVGARDGQLFRERLNNYLQVSEKFTSELEAMAQSDALLAWQELLHRVNSRDELNELHGACQRVLESFPAHPGLLSISASTRLKPTADDLRRSDEELKAALRYTAEASNIDDAKQLGDAVVSYVADVDENLADKLQGSFGLWLINNGRKDEAVKRFFIRKAVRDQWISSLLNDVMENIPSVEDISK